MFKCYYFLTVLRSAKSDLLLQLFTLNQLICCANHNETSNFFFETVSEIRQINNHQEEWFLSNKVHVYHRKLQEM